MTQSFTAFLRPFRLHIRTEKRRRIYAIVSKQARKLEARYGRAMATERVRQRLIGFAKEHEHSSGSFRWTLYCKIYRLLKDNEDVGPGNGTPYPLELSAPIHKTVH